MLFTNALYAQTNRKRLNNGIDAAVEKAVREHNAKQKKAEEAKRKEREREQRQEQQRRQHEANFNRQIENLNSVSADDYITGPRQQTGTEEFQATTYKEEEPTKAPVATPRKNTNNRQASSNNSRSGRSNFGTPSYSGNNYPDDRYTNKPAGFGNTQKNRQQARVPASQIRGQYKPRRTMNQRVVNINNANIKPKTYIPRPQQQNNIQNGGNARTRETLTQQRNVQNTNNMQIQQKRVQKKKAWIENGKLVLDPSQGPIHSSLQQSNSSSDLKTVDITKPEQATKVKEITAYDIPHEAYYLSGGNKKIISTYAGSGRTIDQQAQLMNKDRMNGMKSFENPKEWENIYGVYNAGRVKTSSTVTVTKKRN